MSFEDVVIGGVRVPRWTPDDPEAPSNFGDEIGPLLVRALAGEAHAEGEPRLLSVGSVLQFTEPGDVVWGAGINGKVRQRLRHPLDVRAVRGPLTRAVLLGFGIPTPAVFGDPALLLPRLLPDLVPDAPCDLIVMPNLNELGRVSGEHVLSPLGDPLAIARRIAGARFVVASSLHALVLADAFGVPSRPLVPAAEHPFKYLDYYAGTGRPDVRFASSVEEALDLGPVGSAEVDLDLLASAFPDDLWEAGERRLVDPTSRSYARQRDASWRARDEIALAIGRDAPDSAAQALLRAQQLVAEQPPALTALLEACSEGVRATGSYLASATVRYLRENDARGDIDRRVSRALRRAIAERGAGDGSGGVVCRVAATGKVSLARAIARGEADSADGLAHLGEADPLPPEDPATPGLLARARSRWRRGA
ncbi:polysaccharide pyruvyl transferase family protein [Microbacterium karelineae]|uniref:polysaccharide pyruvyl transferase family protein n=1 Tax=Microbacterium karelineae TaxID=2654283 RepID=UPI0012EA3515|nr:polysaccharide pyruvyl transferase family protein [Microbacterium karelineae]